VAKFKEHSMASQQGSNSGNQKQQDQSTGSSSRSQQGSGQAGNKQSGNQAGTQSHTRGGSSEQHAEAGRQSHKNSR
jgi:hypothetical protein